MNDETAIVAVTCFVCEDKMKLEVPKEHADPHGEATPEGEPIPMHEAKVYQGDRVAEAFTLGVCPKCRNLGEVLSMLGMDPGGLVPSNEELARMVEEGQSYVGK
jgi:hypothetical protein